jgi:hypothetical protein
VVAPGLILSLHFARFAPAAFRKTVYENFFVSSETSLINLTKRTLKARMERSKKNLRLGLTDSVLLLLSNDPSLILITEDLEARQMCAHPRPHWPDSDVYRARHFLGDVERAFKSSRIHPRKLPTKAPWVIRENAGVIESKP